ncbi:hypothetical protein BGW42_000595 [Actinomortierella wolfii]|nr:hypothetical protein BGW42_000595 [Actinomortierella wolfii]
MEVGYPIRRANITTWVSFEAEVKRVTARPELPGELSIEEHEMSLGRRDKPSSAGPDLVIENKIVPAATSQEFRDDVGPEIVQKVGEKDGMAALTEMFECWTLMALVGLVRAMCRMSRDLGPKVCLVNNTLYRLDYLVWAMVEVETPFILFAVDALIWVIRPAVALKHNVTLVMSTTIFLPIALAKE